VGGTISGGIAYEIEFRERGVCGGKYLKKIVRIFPNLMKAHF